MGVEWLFVGHVEQHYGIDVSLIVVQSLGTILRNSFPVFSDTAAESGNTDNKDRRDNSRSPAFLSHISNNILQSTH